MDKLLYCDLIGVFRMFGYLSVSTLQATLECRVEALWHLNSCVFDAVVKCEKPAHRATSPLPPQSTNKRTNEVGFSNDKIVYMLYVCQP